MASEGQEAAAGRNRLIDCSNNLSNQSIDLIVDRSIRTPRVIRTLNNLNPPPLPPTTGQFLKDGQAVDLTGAELFKGKKVAVFGVPGCFTPTCSNTHAPGA